MEEVIILSETAPLPWSLIITCFIPSFQTYFSPTLKDSAKKQGTPWLLAKGFDGSCPVSKFLPKEALTKPQETRLWLDVNGVRKQDGNTRDMIFPIPALLEHITKWITLSPGDVVLTGTPAGVGPVQPGDSIRCGLGDDLIIMEFPVVK